MSEKRKTDAIQKTDQDATLPPITSETAGSHTLPSVLKPDVWAIPATPQDVGQAASFLATATQMGLPAKQRMSGEEHQAFTRMLRSYDYTRAELLLAMREVPRDPERFGGRGATVQDVHRVISQHRTLRARLRQQISAKQRDDLCAEIDELKASDFKCSGFNGFNEPLYRYAPDVPQHAGSPRAELAANHEGEHRPGQRRNREEEPGQTVSLREAMDFEEGAAYQQGERWMFSDKKGGEAA